MLLNNLNTDDSLKVRPLRYLIKPKVHGVSLGTAISFALSKKDRQPERKSKIYPPKYQESNVKDTHIKHNDLGKIQASLEAKNLK